MLLAPLAWDCSLGSLLNWRVFLKDRHAGATSFDILDCLIYGSDELIDINTAISIQINFIDDGVELLTLPPVIDQQFVDFRLIDLAIIVLVKQPECLLQLFFTKFHRDIAGEGHKLAILDFVGPIQVNHRKDSLHNLLSLYLSIHLGITVFEFLIAQDSIFVFIQVLELSF